MLMGDQVNAEFILIYLHSFASSISDNFCRNVLYNPAIVEALNLVQFIFFPFFSLFLISNLGRIFACGHVMRTLWTEIVLLKRLIWRKNLRASFSRNLKIGN